METPPTPTPQPRWTTLPPLPRRVLGVLVEKAKTTPDQYPLSIAALTTGCNQKNNRDPQMDVDSDDVQQALDMLRQIGAAGEVQGSGRVPRYRHYMKEWMGVDGVELAVMAELLLRGAQTVGELRGRAARMAGGQLPDLNALKPVLNALQDKRLVIRLTPAGRGQLVTHGLYPPEELDRVRKKSGGTPQHESVSPPISTPNRSAPASAAPTSTAPTSTAPAPWPQASPQPVTPPAPPPQADHGHGGPSTAALADELQQLRAEVAQLRNEINDLWDNVRPPRE